MNTFVEINKLEVKNKLPGVSAAFFQDAKNCTVAYTEMKAGVEDPMHNHPFEVVGIVLKGEFEMEIAGKTEVYKPGIISYIPPHVFHAVKAVTDCKVITVMYPEQELQFV